MAGWSRVGMNHEKDQNHLAGCSFILSAGQCVCVGLCVWPVQREWGLCESMSECVGVED